MKLEILAVGFIAIIPLAATYSGDMTYYTPGPGSCGWTSSDGDGIVALSTQMMGNGGNPNANDKCGSKIGIYNPKTGSYVVATVVDTCQACGEFDIDVDSATFKAAGVSLDEGRVHGVDWGGVKVGG